LKEGAGKAKSFGWEGRKGKNDETPGIAGDLCVK
jgi:hypothetical protein